jgi:hypothetical protein
MTEHAATVSQMPAPRLRPREALPGGLSERGSPRASGEFLHAIFGGCEARRSSGAYHR